jgi:predicted homoserine dehydrogenase-like protein
VWGGSSYGLVENVVEARKLAALPIALSEGCVMRRNVSKDKVLSFEDVKAPASGLINELWREQNAQWPLATRESQVLSMRHVTAEEIQ